MFQSLFGSLINHLHHNANNNVLICITSILTTIYSLKVCSVYGGSCHNYSPKSIHVLLASVLLTSRKKFKNVLNQSRLVWIVCLVSVLCTAFGSIKDFGNSFPQYWLPGLWLTYIYYPTAPKRVQIMHKSS